MTKIKDRGFRIVCIVGPTASGKSELAIKLAKKFNGEIISVDSRQIYKGIDIGTGKVEGKWTMVNNKSGRPQYKPFFIYKNIIHHCIDFVSPHKQYSVAQFKRVAEDAIKNISKRGKLPILCGGTGHFMDAVVFNQTLPEVKPNSKLRKKLDSQSASQLYQQLIKLDPVRASTIDRHNKRRLVRALEIVLTTGKPVPISVSTPESRMSANGGSTVGGRLRDIRDPELSQILDPGSQMHSSGVGQPYNPLWLGITLPQEVLYKKIDKRLHQRLKKGMTEEVQRLRNGSWSMQSPSPLGEGLRERLQVQPPYPKSSPPAGGLIINLKSPQGLSWHRLESLGLEYKYIALYLQGKLSFDEMVKQLSYAIKHYSKRQLTWWKRNKNIHWISSELEAKQLVTEWLQKTL